MRQTWIGRRVAGLTPKHIGCDRFGIQVENKGVGAVSTEAGSARHQADARLCAEPHAPDHQWVKTHPEYYVEGSEEMLPTAPENYLRIYTDWGPKILAFGRDPNFPGWPDTLQLNYANPAL